MTKNVHLIPFSPPVIVACSIGHAAKVMTQIGITTLQFTSDNFINNTQTHQSQIHFCCSYFRKIQESSRGTKCLGKNAAVLSYLAPCVTGAN